MAVGGASLERNEGMSTAFLAIEATGSNREIGRAIGETAHVIWDLEAMTADICVGTPCANARRRFALG